MTKTRQILEFICATFITDKKEIIEMYQIEPPWHFQLDAQLILLKELGLIEYPEKGGGAFRSTKKLNDLL